MIFTSNSIKEYLNSAMGDTGLLVPGWIWLPLPFVVIFRHLNPNITQHNGISTVALVCVRSPHTFTGQMNTFSSLKWDQGSREQSKSGNWEFQSETLLLTEVTDWMLYKQRTLTKHSFVLHVLSTACPSLSVFVPLCNISISYDVFCSPATLFLPSFHRLHMVSITGDEGSPGDQGWKK